MTDDRTMLSDVKALFKTSCLIQNYAVFAKSTVQMARDLVDRGRLLLEGNAHKMPTFPFSEVQRLTKQYL